MKNMKRALLLAVICCFTFAGCGGKNESTDSDASKNSEAIVSTEENGADAAPGETPTASLATDRNPLTGEPMEPSIATLRPATVMVGNTVDAMPQYGTSAADVLFEMPVEGGLTRLMIVVQDYPSLATVMSVRSCRHYYAYVSEEFDAIYVHYGQAVYATEMLNAVDDLNGLEGVLENVTYFRDSSRKSPHNAYVNGESIIAGINLKGYRNTLEEGYPGHFTFAADGATVDLSAGKDAAVVVPGYTINKPWFEYNADDGLYYRYQYKSAHTDANNNEQLKFKNIIIQECDYVMEPDNTYLDVKTNGSGGGYYISNGKAVEISWSKADDNSQTKYFDVNGNEIVLNQGKTYVGVVLNDAVSKIGIFETKEAFNAN